MAKCALNFICKNEGHIILKMLASAKPITDLIVANDTGSTDNTVDLIRRFGKDHEIPTFIFERSFDDFASSRNHALDKLREVITIMAWDPGEVWGFWMDCDDTLVIQPDFSKEALREKRYRIVKHIGEFRFPRSTFFRLSEKFKWEGPIHETLFWEDKNIDPHLLEGLYIVSGKDSHSSKGDQVMKYTWYGTVLEGYIQNKDPHFRWKYLAGTSFMTAASFENYREGRIQLLTKAMAFLEQAKAAVDINKEYLYCSQYYIALIQDQLEYPWAIVEEAFLKARDIDPVRGEWMMEVILHYLRSGNAEMAYAYSRRAVGEYYARNPYPKRVLEVKEAFYNWQVLELHSIACKHTNRLLEGENLRLELQSLLVKYPHWFNERERQRIAPDSTVLIP